MLAMTIVVIMLLLAVLLTVVYLPRLQKPAFKRNFHFESAKEIDPKNEEDLAFHNRAVLERFPIEIKHLDTPRFNLGIPDRYNEDKISLLVRDPEWLFAYWEISSSSCEYLKKHHGDNIFNNSHMVIRVFNVTLSEKNPEQFDLHVSEDATRAHIHVTRPNNSYYVVIGRKTFDGRFIPILYSNRVQTPRASVSPVLDKDWLPPYDYAHLLYQDCFPVSSDVFQQRKD